ncbi:uncharacterized protein CTRU02_214586 [Colletotrichum truncatum]|uniref:Uncharacterized protein n=1 Tax=Colletotrichum truncatum TaxID=5467 RepID=A0ACC3YF91_COLTU|nr:uncharacterized protein CTRU02_09533 [Colletotrichum truncatum]KAF6788215.1 hypothetical protein CTRU02_09533 [Colletotrichum truncatum]
MKFQTNTVLAALVGLAAAEVPQEHSHEKYLKAVNALLALDNPFNIQDSVFGLLGNAAAQAGAGDVTNPDCLHQITADSAFSAAKAAGDVDGMASALVFRAIERNTGSVGLKSVLCDETAQNPEIAALTQHQDPASENAAEENKAITLELARQLASVGADPLLALESGTFAPGDPNDSTGAGNSCNDIDDAEGCIFTQGLLVEDATPEEIQAAVADVAGGGGGNAGNAGGNNGNAGGNNGTAGGNTGNNGSGASCSAGNSTAVARRNFRRSSRSAFGSGFVARRGGNNANANGNNNNNNNNQNNNGNVDNTGDAADNTGNGNVNNGGNQNDNGNVDNGNNQNNGNANNNGAADDAANGNGNNNNNQNNNGNVDNGNANNGNNNGNDNADDVADDVADDTGNGNVDDTGDVANDNTGNGNANNNGNQNNGNQNNGNQNNNGNVDNTDDAADNTGNGNANNGGNQNNGNQNNGNAGNGNAGNDNADNNNNNNNNNNNAGNGAATGTDVQTFTGNLGGPPPPVTSSSASKPFEVNGSTFQNAGAALQRSCAVQHNACADAANSGAEDISVADCDAQEDDCLAAASLKKLRRSSSVGSEGRRMRIAVIQSRQSLDFGDCQDPSIQFAAGLDGRQEASFGPAGDFDHGSAQNINIISSFICSQLSSRCQAGDDAVAACEQGQADAQGLQGQAAADAFNSALGL